METGWGGKETSVFKQGFSTSLKLGHMQLVSQSAGQFRTEADT